MKGFDMQKPQVIVFGNGDKVLTSGEYGGEPCVFISDAKQPASVGDNAEREGICDDYLGENPIIIVTRNERRATLLHMLLTGQLDNINL
ncbi:MAG: hypothetical protein ACRDA8_16275 [Shewanella sp.]